MTLLWIILATLAGGVVSVFLAATLALTALAQFANRMVAFAVGVLLGFALTDLLPEAVELGLDITTAGWVLLAGIMGFFYWKKWLYGDMTTTCTTVIPRTNHKWR